MPVYSGWNILIGLIEQEHSMPVPPRATLTPMALAAMELLHDGPKHPYEIHQTMQEREVWRLLKLTTGSLYHAIDRLERDGLVEAVETSREGRRPERTTYRLTEAGEDAFAQRLRAIVAEPATEYPQYAVAVAFLHTLDRADALVQLRRRALALEATVAAERVIHERLSTTGIHELYWADVELRLRLRETELAWTLRLIERLESRRLTWPNGAGGTTPTSPRLSLVDEAKQENAG
jgi:DNA-binding PadR family transcriptional regulator